MLMLLLGILFSYQIIFFILVEVEVLKEGSTFLKFSIFLLSIILGFVISFMAFAVDSINFVILGFAAGSQIAFVYG